MKTYDIVIIGGGFVGLSALIGLKHASQHLKIALIDAKVPPKKANGGRSIVLSYASQKVFSNWGCWQPLSLKSFPLREVHISQSGVFGRLKITAKKLNIPALGYVISENQLNEFLSTQISNCDYFHQMTCTDLRRQDGKMHLTIQGPKGLEHWVARLVLAADGAHSKIRTLAGIPVDACSYDYQAIVTDVMVKYPNQIAYERFIGNEILALVPRGGNQYGVIWKAPQEKIDQLMHLSSIEFLSILSTQFGFRLGPFEELGVRKTYPLHRIRALKETFPGLVLIGDAAHSNPPIAAQGLNLSIRDIAVFITKLEECIKNNQDFGSEDFLKTYEDLRLMDQAKTISLINFPMTRTFQAVPDILKGFGWLGIDLFVGISRRFAHFFL